VGKILGKRVRYLAEKRGIQIYEGRGPADEQGGNYIRARRAGEVETVRGKNRSHECHGKGGLEERIGIRNNSQKQGGDGVA